MGEDDSKENVVYNILVCFSFFSYLFLFLLPGLDIKSYFARFRKI